MAIDYNSTTAFKYDGSKATIRPWIAKFVPSKGRHYVEPFAGRGNVFWLLSRVCNYQTWQLNDIRTGTPDGFLNGLLNVDVKDIPYHVRKEDWEHWVKLRRDGTPLGAVMEAVLCRNSGTYDSGVEFQGSGGIWSCADGVEHRSNYARINFLRRILRARQCLEQTKCSITDLDYVNLPWDGYTQEDFAYLDPPYLDVCVSSYSEKDFDHEQMIHILKSTRCRWLMSEYEQPVYNKAFGKPVATYYTVQTMSSKGGGGPQRIECLYANFPIKFRRIQYSDRGTKVEQKTLDIMNRNRVVFMQDMERILKNSGYTGGKVREQLKELKYHPDICFNGKVYYWMGK
jgi:site-specific DNA-adenine methylase